MERYLVTINQRRLPVLVTSRAAGELTFAIDGTEYRARVERSVVANKTVASENGAMHSTEHSGVVTAPMPGIVSEISVNLGVIVTGGDPLLVIEAMKMENQIRAPVSGTVNTIHIAKGAEVPKGALLITITPR